MRCQVRLFCLLIVGCGNQEPAAPLEKPREESVKYREPSAKRLKVKKQRPVKRVPAAEIAGSDWPTCLGPQGTSVSSEKGILAPWPEKGLRIVWEKEVGTGYGMP